MFRDSAGRCNLAWVREELDINEEITKSSITRFKEI